MINIIKTGLIIAFSFLKKAFCWSIKIENFKKIKTQLDLLSNASKFFGSTTKLEFFNDVDDYTIAIAKTMQNVLDGRSDKQRQEFIKRVNIDKEKLRDLSFSLNTEKGIIVDWKGVRGSYNPKDGSVSLKL